MLTALAMVLAAINPVPIVAQRDLIRARDRWLRVVMALGGVWAASIGEFWMTVLVVWILLSWRSAAFLPWVTIWAGIVGTWLLLKAMPPQAYFWIPWGWLAVATAQVGLTLYHAITTDWSIIKRPTFGHRGKGWLGSPVTTAFFLAIVSPFAPWWLWPVLLAGFYFTCSWSALLAAAVGLVWVIPWLWPFLLM